MNKQTALRLIVWLLVVLLLLCSGAITVLGFPFVTELIR